MNEHDFQLIRRAKKQTQRETSIRSFLMFAIIMSAALRFMGVQSPVFYFSLFAVLLISLLLTSSLITDLGGVSKNDLIDLAERQIHNDPEMLTRYSISRPQDRT